MEEQAKPRVPFIIGVAGGSSSGKVTYFSFHYEVSILVV